MHALASKLLLLSVVALLVVGTAAAQAHPQHHGPHTCPKAYPDLGWEAGDFEAERLIGLRLERARRTAVRHDCTVRVVRVDGEWLGVTDDLRPNRINVELVDERVKRIDGVY